MPTYSAPIVGSHWRPPAKAILQVLPANCPLVLRHDPENEFSTEAIAVYLRSADIPQSAHQELELHGPGYGFSLESILAQAEWHLGYIAEIGNKKDGAAAQEFRETLGLPGAEQERPATLGFGPTGNALAKVDSAALQQSDEEE